METNSPTYREEAVIDLDFGFKVGTIESQTLYPSRGDTFARQDGELVIVVHLENGAVEETVIYAAELAWRRRRDRIAKILIESPLLAGGAAQPGLQDSSDTGDATSPVPAPEG